VIWFFTRLVALALALAFGLWWVGRGYRRARRLAAESVAAQAALVLGPALAERFLAAANATGKPRGLRWTALEWASTPPVFARDLAGGELYALVGASFSFTAVAGGDMEGVEAVGDVRGGTAVFVWRGGRWGTDGRAVLNLEPGETLARYAKGLLAIDRDGKPTEAASR
jgi:hypothetical protein